ncbi:MAG: hypothetical protein D6756_13675 [Cyanobacteria bacterium J083]|nr:MAG: hypothetical protein D6756_13675 [Cyanobacteria bacterium J083]
MEQEDKVIADLGIKPPTGEGSMVKKPPADIPWQEWIEPVVDFLGKLPDELGSFFSDYKKPLITLLVFLSGLVTVYVTLAVLDAINDIPLLAPFFELVGIGYTGWFAWRYLLKAETRSELIAEFEALKSQVVGKNSGN